MPELWESTSVMESCGWEFLLPLNAGRHVPLPGIQERRKPWWTDICNGPGGREVGGYGVMCDVPWRVGTAPCEACKARHALQWTTGTYRLHARIAGGLGGGVKSRQARGWLLRSDRTHSTAGSPLATCPICFSRLRLENAVREPWTSLATWARTRLL